MKTVIILFLCMETFAFSKEISFEALKMSASEHSHRLNLRSLDVQIEQARLDSIYSTLYPQLSLGYSGEYNRSQLPIISLYSSYYLYGSDRDNFSRGFEDIRANSWNAGVSLRWALFEGFKYNSESERLKLELSRIREESELAKREFDYETRTRQEKLNRLSLLTKNETEALNETAAKLAMTQRLRAQGEADAVSEVSVKLESLERELTLESEKIQHAYEAESLRLQHMGVDQCRGK